MTQNREPKEVQAWLIGGGIASLAAAVHLIQKAKVPAPQIHILDIHKSSGGAMEEVSGNSEDGYVLHTGAQLYFHEQCVEELLGMVPSQDDPERSILQSIKDSELQGPTNKARTRAVRLDEEGRLKVDTHRMHIGMKLRMALVAFILDHERASDSREIREVFENSFFQTDFWALWSTTFFLQPWHSATEFRRLLIKYLPSFQTYDGVTELERTRFSSHESLVVPTTQYLKSQGVDFRFHALVTGLKSYPSSDPTTISEIIMLEDGKEKLITVDPSDIVIATLGSISAGMRTGSNKEPPAAVSTESFKDGNWSLWDQLAKQSSKFGNPVAFYSRANEAKIATFTVTLRESDFMKHYLELTKEKSATGSLLTITGSPWGLHISVPRQPVIAAQPANVDLVWGYGLHPDKEGTYVKKPMEQCSGEEILFEVLSHMNFPTEPLLASATTIPSLVPLGTSMLLTRVLQDRPSVIPHNTTNVAFIGQYVEIPDDTTFSVEYSVRGAQIAVSRLMGLGQGPPKISKNIPLEVFHLLV